jgi:hypothetical protein
MSFSASIDITAVKEKTTAEVGDCGLVVGKNKNDKHGIPDQVRDDRKIVTKWYQAGSHSVVGLDSIFFTFYLFCANDLLRRL